MTTFNLEKLSRAITNEDSWIILSVDLAVALYLTDTVSWVDSPSYPDTSCPPNLIGQSVANAF